MEHGTLVPASSLQALVVQQMIEDGVIQKVQSGRTKASLVIKDTTAFKNYLFNHFGISNLGEYVEALSSEDLARSEAVTVSGNSKLKPIRTFKGFLVNSYEPVHATLNEESFLVNPAAGSFSFIYDYDRFVPAKSVTIVGIENPENFRFVHQQQYLFTGIQPLFVCRYPQSNDLVRWLQSIPNAYLHFGDLDFAGLNIYFNEYEKYLGAKASLFVPRNIEELLDKYGNRDLYNKQLHLASRLLEKAGVQELLRLFHRYKKVLEQEVLIKR